MPSTLNPDIFYSLATEIGSFRSSDNLNSLLSLSLTCRVFRDACLPVVFADVHWPHRGKHDEESGLHFFPTNLWPYFRHFRLAWPDDWPDASPPRWGDKYHPRGEYHPRHIDKLVSALPRMTFLTSFSINCPFRPSNSILNALIACTNLRSLSINDTPLYTFVLPSVPSAFQLERLSLTPVAEALRVGEGPYDTKYAEAAYYIREFRRMYKNNMLAPIAASTLLFQFGKSSSLCHVEISGDLCTLEGLAAHEWPKLHTLVLTGHAPKPQGTAELVDVLAQMRNLRELRLLFSRTKGDSGFHILPPGNGPSMKNNSPMLLSSLKYLALSNACSFEGVFHYTTSLERLAICAIIDHPRIPIALNRGVIDLILKDIAIGCSSSHLVRLQIMIEDKVNPALCHAIAVHCSKLEVLEIELCGYHDGKSIFAWSEFAHAFGPLTSIRDLRICIQFPEYDEMDCFEPWRNTRRECAMYLAGRIPTLKRVGFEYRKRTGTHRYEDNWLEYDIERRKHDGGIELFELVPSWYPFPELWCPVSVAV